MAKKLVVVVVVVVAVVVVYYKTVFAFASVDVAVESES